jgi:hypothetical protein
MPFLSDYPPQPIYPPPLSDCPLPPALALPSRLSSSFPTHPALFDNPTRASSLQPSPTTRTGIASSPFDKPNLPGTHLSDCPLQVPARPLRSDVPSHIRRSMPAHVTSLRLHSTPHAPSTSLPSVPTTRSSSSPSDYLPLSSPTHFSPTSPSSHHPDRSDKPFRSCPTHFSSTTHFSLLLPLPLRLPASSPSSPLRPKSIRLRPPFLIKPPLSDKPPLRQLNPIRRPYPLLPAPLRTYPTSHPGPTPVQVNPSRRSIPTRPCSIRAIPTVRLDSVPLVSLPTTSTSQPLTRQHNSYRQSESSHTRPILFDKPPPVTSARTQPFRQPISHPHRFCPDRRPYPALARPRSGSIPSDKPPHALSTRIRPSRFDYPPRAPPRHPDSTALPIHALPVSSQPPPTSLCYSALPSSTIPVTPALAAPSPSDYPTPVRSSPAVSTQSDKPIPIPSDEPALNHLRPHQLISTIQNKRGKRNHVCL